MKVELWLIGKTSFGYIKEGMEIYQKRLTHYLPFEVSIIPDIKNAKNLRPNQIKVKEGATINSKLKKEDFLILLDERGKHFSSVEFAKFLDQKLQMSYKKIVFLVGGAYGFSEEIYKRANSKLSLSKMTFSHQMIRLFVLEQIYRGMTILRNEPYHNEG
ncbi:MAG: 23S rRNA (pseudouridine(1915)-N(3))-methyltransferase RlmH [Saprospiraceae bacterium]|nr:23S rRNA (pseudouridine(1915)-N(3))-methyltransferase RlmH [Saprospiraceae bacterium]